VAVVAVVAALGVMGPGRIGEALIGNNVGAAPVSGLETLSARVELWSRALYAIQDFPFTGMGMGTFGYVVPVLYPLFMISPDVVILHAHDEFLQVAVDLGLPGLVSFLAIYLLIGWTLLCVLRRNTDPFYRLIAFAILAGLISHIAWGVTDAILLGAKPAVFWWALLGLGAATFLLTEQADIGSAIHHSTEAKAGESPAPNGVAAH
jgi:putative inorganic carbon (HCO3(-)) transporter